MEKEKVAEDKPNRVFIDQSGKFYAAPEPLHVGDAETTLPTEEMIVVLSTENKPIYREEMNKKINELKDSRIEHSK